MRLRRAGFTYIEVVISIALVIFTIMLFDATLKVLPASRLVRDEDTALRIVNKEIEILRGGGYAALPSSGAFTDPALAQLPSGSGSLSVTTYNSGTKQVGVTVTWAEPTNGTHSVTLTTLVTQVGGLP